MYTYIPKAKKIMYFKYKIKDTLLSKGNSENQVMRKKKIIFEKVNVQISVFKI